MAVSILLVTHMQVGEALLHATQSILGKLPLSTDTFPVALNVDRDLSLEQLNVICNRIDENDGVLILTDMYGATPDNIAVLCSETNHASVVSGVNLPMLIRVMNYCQLPLHELVKVARDGAISNINIH